MTTVESNVAIIGAGVFGLTTALHLKQRGYKNVTVYDHQPYDVNAYRSSEGCDSASADYNKIYRCAYGTETEYQDLAISGRSIWLDWNRQIASSKPEDLPKGLTPQDKLLSTNGFLTLNDGSELSQYDRESLEELEKAGLREHQHVITDETDLQRLWDKEKGSPTPSHWKEKITALNGDGTYKLTGFMDTSAGFTYADKACVWVRHLAEKEGVRFVLGPQVGKFDEFVFADGGKKITGLRTVDGKEHAADVVVVAGGGWTPSIVPEVDGLLQTTAGSVTVITLPKERQDLWDKFSEDKFPTWAYGFLGETSPEFGGFYGFPRTEDGIIKIGYRGRKWTNFQTHPKTGKRLSVPKTKFTEDKATNLPLKAVNHIKKVVGDLLPELKDIGITDTRMCWYTDSIDNSFVIDYVPGYDNSLFVASGGSGHGFKFLPVLGKHVVNALEGTKDQFTPLFKWRSLAEGQDANGLDEGESSGRDLKDLELAQEKDWAWSKDTVAV